MAALGSLLEGDRVALRPGWETLEHFIADDPATGPLDVAMAPVRSILQPQFAGLGDLAPLHL